MAKTKGKKRKRPASGKKFAGATASSTYEATAYGPPWGGINGEGTATACGVKLNKGAPKVNAVAAGDNHPCGQILLIKPNPVSNNWRPFVVWDRGGAIGARNIDFYLNNRADQTKWGRRSVQVKATNKSIKVNGRTPEQISEDLNRSVVGWGDSLGDIVDTVTKPLEWGENLIAFISRLFEPSFWLRVGKGVLGSVALIMGVVILARALLGIDLPGYAERTARGARRRLSGSEDGPVDTRRRSRAPRKTARSLDRQRDKIEANRNWQKGLDQDVPF